MSAVFIQVLQENPHPISTGAASALYQKMPDTYRRWVSESDFADFFCSNDRSSIYWHDYEAGGTDPAIDTPLQHAGIRTDLQLRIIDEPNDWYCQLAGDRLPHPYALLLTKISLQVITKKGLPEPVFFRHIYQEMSVPMTCNAGYNSLKYDDEMTRFGFYRNLLPVYEREFTNGNSRWDLLPITAAVAAWDPTPYQWPVSDAGVRSLKLELLAKSNELTQENAHNAVDDVLATIQWARCIKARSPELYAYFFARRSKNTIAKDLVTGALGMFASPMCSEQGYAVPVLVLGQPYGNDKNKFIMLDLSNVENIRSLWRLCRQGPDTVKKALFMSKEDRAQNGVERLPLMTTALNKCPMFIRHDHPFACAVDWVALEPVVRAIQDQTEEAAYVRRTILTAMSSDDFDNEGDAPETLLYQGFPDRRDQQNIKLLASMSLSEVFSTPMQWQDAKFAELWRLSKCKYMPISELSHDDAEFWKAHCQQRLLEPLRRSEKHQGADATNIHALLQDLNAPQLVQEYEAFWPDLFKHYSPENVSQPGL